MLTVCAWCDRYMGAQGPAETHVHVTHGICPTCAAGQGWKDSPVLVLSRARAHLAPVFAELLRGVPAVRIVVDRRRADRRQEDGSSPADGERRREERRQKADLAVD